MFYYATSIRAVKNSKTKVEFWRPDFRPKRIKTAQKLATTSPTEEISQCFEIFFCLCIFVRFKQRVCIWAYKYTKKQKNISEI